MIKFFLKDGIFITHIKSGLEKLNILAAWDVNINSFYTEFEKDTRECFYTNENNFLSDISKSTELREINKASVYI